MSLDPEYMPDERPIDKIFTFLAKRFGEMGMVFIVAFVPAAIILLFLFAIA